MATLLQIVQDATDEVGVTRPTAVYSNTDDQIRTLLAMSNRQGRDLARSADWTILQRTHTFTTTASTAEYSLPDDFGRVVRDTEWDRAERRPMFGSTSPQKWQEIKSSLIGSGVVGKRYRIFRSASAVSRKIVLDPTPTVTGDTIAFEYISSHWCVDSTETTTAAAWAADTDISLLDQDLMTLGLIIRFKRSNGFDFSSEADEYKQLMSELVSRDRPAPTLYLDSTPDLPLLGPWSAPETGFGS